MSADNGYAVWEDNEGMWNVAHVFVSPMDDDCMYLHNLEPQFRADNRGKALVYAHDAVKKEYIVEYGVMELDLPKKPCGRCFTCINDRGIVDPDLDRCDHCGKLIHDSQWKALDNTGVYHGYCARNKEREQGISSARN